MTAVAIELERLVCPEFAEEVECTLCERPFILGTVIARVWRDAKVDCGEVCPECALYLSAGPMGHSGKFPTIEEFARRFAEWDGPEYALEAEAARALGFE